MRSVTSTRGRSSSASGSTSMPLTRADPSSQTGRAPISTSASAKSSPPVRMAGAAPQVEHQRARPVAVVLQMPAQQIGGGALGQRQGGAGRHGARVDGEQVAPGRQHIGPPARRRARPARAARSRPSSAAQQRRRLGRRAARRGALPAVPDRRPGRRGAAPPAAPPGARRRRAAEHVQPVADLQILDVAQIGVEPRQRLVLRRVARHAAFGQQPGRLGAVQDVPAQQRGAAAVEPVGGGVFVDQPFQFGGRAMAAGASQRRRQVADGDRAQPALGHRRLAGVVDDERIDHRQPARQRRRRAGGRQRHRLARQPFQRAVRAQMHQRVDVHRLRAATDRTRHRRAAAAGRDRDRPPGGPARAAVGLHRERRSCRAARGAARTRRRQPPGRPPARPRRRGCARAAPPAGSANSAAILGQRQHRRGRRLRQQRRRGRRRRRCRSPAPPSSDRIASQAGETCRAPPHARPARRRRRDNPTAPPRRAAPPPAWRPAAPSPARGRRPARCRPASGRCTVRANSSPATGAASALNEIAVVSSRPSSSGSTTCIARSACDRPRAEPPRPRAPPRPAPVAAPARRPHPAASRRPAPR